MPGKGNRQEDGEAVGGKELKSKRETIHFRQQCTPLRLCTADTAVNICEQTQGTGTYNYLPPPLHSITMRGYIPIFEGVLETSSIPLV